VAGLFWDDRGPWGASWWAASWLALWHRRVAGVPPSNRLFQWIGLPESASKLPMPRPTTHAFTARWWACYRLVLLVLIYCIPASRMCCPARPHALWCEK